MEAGRADAGTRVNFALRGEAAEALSSCKPWQAGRSTWESEKGGGGGVKRPSVEVRRLNAGVTEQVYVVTMEGVVPALVYVQALVPARIHRESLLSIARVVGFGRRARAAKRHVAARPPRLVVVRDGGERGGAAREGLCRGGSAAAPASHARTKARKFE